MVDHAPAECAGGGALGGTLTVESVRVVGLSSTPGRRRRVLWACPVGCGGGGGVGTLVGDLGWLVSALLGPEAIAAGPPGSPGGLWASWFRARPPLVGWVGRGWGVWGLVGVGGSLVGVVLCSGSLVVSYRLPGLWGWARWVWRVVRSLRTAQWTRASKMFIRRSPLGWPSLNVSVV